jgi:Tol biopolymer transport system component
MSRRLLVLVGLVAMGLALAPAAHAAFPGENGKIAFHDYVAEDFDAEIFSINPDGTARTQLTSNVVEDSQPAWSPDGARIVFQRVIFDEPLSRGEIWVMNADGTGQTRLTQGNGGPDETNSFDTDPAFSGDGTRIVFTREPAGEVQDANQDIWIMNADGSGQTQLTEHPGDDFEATVSPNSQLIAYSREFVGDTDEDAEAEGSGDARAAMTGEDIDIATMNIDGSNEAIHPDSDFGQFDDEAPNFFPDGSRIAFARCDATEFCIFDADIFSFATAGGSVAQLTDEDGVESDDYFDEDPAYSPDGARLVFSRGLGGFGFAGDDPSAQSESLGGQITLTGSSGGTGTALTDGFNPDWQPISQANRTQSCYGRTATIVGTGKDETIIGTPGNDVIKGKKGDDVIKGKKGDDIICGNRGDDRLFGGRGEDTLIGGKGRDFLKGGSGADQVFGGTPDAKNKPQVVDICPHSEQDKTNNCKLP